MYPFAESLNFTGIAIGVATFVVIGIFHPIVIKGEYWFGVRIWWVFLLSGIGATVVSLLCDNVMWSALAAVWGASSFWSIGELFHQRERVRKGWFPKGRHHLENNEPKDKTHG